MDRKWIRGILVGAGAFVAANVVSNIVFFQLGAPLLFNPSTQSEKLLSVFFEMEPLPLMFTNGPLYLAIAAIIGLLHGAVFVVVEPALPAGRIKKGLAFGGMVWGLMALYFEFHVPFNMFGEPIALVALELLFWVPVVAVEGLVLAWGYGKRKSSAEGHTISTERS
jgi:hypothetical protein